MNLRPFIFAAIGALHLAAQAATGSVDFTIDEYPSLARSAAVADATGAAGYWITDNRFSVALQLTRESLGPFPPPRANAYYNSYDSVTTGFIGESRPDAVREVTWAPGVGLSANSFVLPNQLGITWETAASDDQVSANANWNRSFALKPNSSVTLAGALNFTYSAGGLEPTYEFSHYRGIYPTRAVVLASGREIDETPWDNQLGFGMGLTGKIFDADPRGLDPGTPRPFSEDDFGYSIDSFGHLSLTIFNRSSELLFGAFDITYSVLSPPAIPPVPEPAMWVAMLLGIGTIAGLRRRASNVPGSAAHALHARS